MKKFQSYTKGEKNLFSDYLLNIFIVNDIPLCKEVLYFLIYSLKKMDILVIKESYLF